jgi:hypothetical protein
VLNSAPFRWGVRNYYEMHGPPVQVATTGPGEAPSSSKKWYSTSGASMDGWMDGFIDADPSLWAICSLALWIKYMLSSTRLYHFLDELGASPGPVVATWTGGPCIS